MQPSGLAIDERAMVDGIRRWVSCESPSWNDAAVSSMTALAAADMVAAGAQVRVVPGRDGYGDIAIGDFHPQDRSPGILVFCHLDTVHDVGSLAGPMPWREAGGRCYGPGAFDMKSGTYMALEAMRALRAAGIANRLPIRFVLTSDEESGSPSTRASIEEMARAQRYVLVPEGAQPNGNLVSGRFPSMRLRLWTRGSASHALLQRQAGRSALAAMAKVILAIEAMNDDGCSFTVTHASAGRMVATVPVESYAEVVVTARCAAALDAAMVAIREISLGDSGCTLEVAVKTARPHWVASSADHALWSHARKLGKEIGIELDAETIFGGSDGNFTGAFGVPTLDGLGAVGSDAHQPSESIETASIVPRTRLLASLLATLGTG